MIGQGGGGGGDGDDGLGDFSPLPSFGTAPTSAPTSMPTPTPTPPPTQGGESDGLDASDASTTAQSDALDETTVTRSDPGVDYLLSTACPDGLSNPYGPTQNGWTVGPQNVDPNTNVAGPSGPLSSYAGWNVDSFSGMPPEGVNANASTGGRDVDPYEQPSTVPVYVGAKYVDINSVSGQTTDLIDTVQLADGITYEHYQVSIDGVTYDAYLSDETHRIPGNEMLLVPASSSPALPTDTQMEQLAQPPAPSTGASDNGTAANSQFSLDDPNRFVPAEPFAFDATAAPSGAMPNDEGGTRTFQWVITTTSPPGVAPGSQAQTGTPPSPAPAAQARAATPPWEMTPWGPMPGIRINANGELEVPPQPYQRPDTISEGSGKGYADMMYDMGVISHSASPGGAHSSLGSLRAAANLARGGDLQSALHQMAVGDAITQGLSIAASIAAPMLARANKTSLASPGPESIASPGSTWSTIGAEGLPGSAGGSVGASTLVNSPKPAFSVDMVELQLDGPTTVVTDDGLPPQLLESLPPTGPSFGEPTGPSLGDIDTSVFENDPQKIDYIDRAGPIDIGSYDLLQARGPGKASGRVGRVGDGLDSDEALQNAALRELLGVNRKSTATSGNPAMALPRALHQTIRNLTRAQMQGRSPNQILQFHLAQMRDFVPEFALRVLESEAQKFIIQTFGSLD